VIVVAVPVKDLVNAKQRLTAVLSAAERSALARAMLTDVLAALGHARVDEVWVVTCDDAVIALARGFRGGRSESPVRVVIEEANRGHTAAAKWAQDAALAAGATTFATVPGDVPCVRATEVDALVAAAREDARGVAFAPSRSGLGTNGAALTPPDVMPLRFGEPSFPDHLAAARRRGLEPRTLDLPGLGLDIDDPDDLRALLAEGAGTASAKLLGTWAVAGRLAGRPGDCDRLARR
jgi:2-phospho-L-lactate guanylyltransferase